MPARAVVGRTADLAWRHRARAADGVWAPVAEVKNEVEGVAIVLGLPFCETGRPSLLLIPTSSSPKVARLSKQMMLQICASKQTKCCK